MIMAQPRQPSDGAPGAEDASGFAGRPLSTLNQDGSRRWLRPRPSRGRYATARRWVAYGLILLFAALPHVTINGKPAILLDVAARRFTLLGRTFLPTDTVLLALFMLGVFVAVFLVTALAGRVWCGWACPQTVYLEFVFRPIERFFEGTPGRAKKNALQRSAAGTILKYAAYVALALFLAHTFLAYFVGVDRLARWVRQSPLEHPGPFLVMAATTLLILFDFGFFREQLCIVACPYGRFQSVMLDRDSLVVMYDRARGEPRGKRVAPRLRPPEGAANGLEGGTRLSLAVLRPEPPAAAQVGDCVDCRMCVATCPTGIDIRDGLQMECINCAQCIDACDAVMTKLGRQTGLIRYSSQAAMAGERRRVLRPRVVVYAAMLTAILGALAGVLLSASEADVTVLRGLGRPFTQLETGEISNPVRVKLVNRTERPAAYTIAAVGEGVRFMGEEETVSVGPGESRTIAGFIVAPPEAFTRGRCEATLRISDGAGFTRDVRYGLLGPGAAARPAPAAGAAGGETTSGEDAEGGGR